MPLQGVGAIAEPARRSLGGAETVWAGTEPPRRSLGGAETVWAGTEPPLEIGERNLPEFVFVLAIPRHRRSLWSPNLLVLWFQRGPGHAGSAPHLPVLGAPPERRFHDGLPSLGAL